MIAAATHSLAGHPDRARDWATNVRERNPLLFWKGLSLILAVIVVVLLYSKYG